MPIGLSGRVLYPPIDQTTLNHLYVEQGEEHGKQLIDGIKAVFPGYQISPGTKLRPREQFARYQQLLLEAYTTPQGIDTAGLAQEVGWLMRDDYLDVLILGADTIMEADDRAEPPEEIIALMAGVPFPKAEPWASTWFVYDVFEYYQRDFQKLMREPVG